VEWAVVSIYRRENPTGNHAFMVANYANGERRFGSYPIESEALEAATVLARQLSEQDVLGAGLTNKQASDYASAVQALAPWRLSLGTTASAAATQVMGDPRTGYGRRSPSSGRRTTCGTRTAATASRWSVMQVG
jgi:hypothetical protein